MHQLFSSSFWHTAVTVLCGLRVKQNCRERGHARAQASTAGVGRQEVGAVTTTRSSNALRMIQGSNHPRTARSARGQDICGRIPFSSLIFFPRSCR